MLRLLYGLVFAALLVLVPGAARSLADVGGVHPGVPPRLGEVTPDEAAAVRMSSALVDFCNHAIVRYRRAMAVVKAPVIVPVPPAIPPGCTQCGEKASGDNAALINAWVNQAAEPEQTAIRDLLSIARVYTLAGYLDNRGSEPDRAALTPLARQCLSQIEPSTILPAVSKLVDRQVKRKAVPMLRKYRAETERMPAGATFALAAEREKQLFDGGNVSADDGVMSTTVEWIRGAFDHYERHLFGQHEYYWCPQYAVLLKELVKNAGAHHFDDPWGRGGTILPGALNTIITDEQMIAMQKRVTDFMHFKVKMDVRLISNDRDSHANIHWTGETDLSFDIDPDKGCFTPKLRDDGVRFTIENWTMRGVSGDQDVNAVSESPRVFDAPATVKLSLCSTAPKLEIRFENFGPPTTVTAKGKPFTVEMLKVAMITTITEDKKRSGQLGKDEAAMKSDMQSLKNEVSKHVNDPSWFTSPAGQAVMAKISGAAGGAGAPVPSNPGQNPAASTDMNVTQNMVLPWQNDVVTTVDRNLTVDRPNTHAVVQVSVANDPQNGSASGKLH